MSNYEKNNKLNPKQVEGEKYKIGPNQWNTDYKNHTKHQQNKMWFCEKNKQEWQTPGGGKRPKLIKSETKNET
jgi:hypothetical protein